MSQLQEQVAIAFTCKRTLQCLKTKIKELSPECIKEVSPEFESLMRSVAAIVGDTIVVDAVNRCTSGQISLLVDENEFRRHLNIFDVKKEIKEEEQERIEQEIMNSDYDEIYEQPDDVPFNPCPTPSNNEDDDDENGDCDLNETIVDIEEDGQASPTAGNNIVNEIPAVKREPISNASTSSDRTLPPAGWPPMRKATSIATTVDLFSSQEEELTQPPLISEFGPAPNEMDVRATIDQSVYEVHMNDMQQKKIVYNSPRYYEIVEPGESQAVFYILPDVNYCYCDQFQDNVFGSREEYTCIHVMCAWMADALGATRICPTPTKKLEAISSLVEERTRDFC